MPRNSVTIGEASRLLGVSIDTLRRWDRAGRLRTERDAANRRLVPAAELERLGVATPDTELSARNRLRGVVRAVTRDGLLARVEIDVTEPARLVAIVTADAIDDLDLRPGAVVTGVVKATSVMVGR